MANANNAFPKNQPLGTAPAPPLGPTPTPAPPRATGAFSKLVGWILMRDAVARAHADVADSLLDSGDDATLA